ncbi:MAG: DUF3369 domain-containing protein [Nitrospirae bacterium]|nr:DUF3369 domain-containing protein [Magnetococcales bacterium]HAT50412.1 hypothetical protein [Alphaproteobacteria bacterium]
MKIIRKSIAPPPQNFVSFPPEEMPVESRGDPWTILVVDDDPDILAVTRISLKDFHFSGRPVRLLCAGSAKEALHIYHSEMEIAVALIDVVMETDDAGLRLVKTIREEIKDRTIRLIIRTGQPGHAPERFVIDNYDIDDYKDKTELTSIKLYTTVRSALKSYRDLKLIETNRQGLEMVLKAAPGMYLHPVNEIQGFFKDALSQVIRLCQTACHVLPHENRDHGAIQGFIATLEKGDLKIRATSEWNALEQPWAKIVLAGIDKVTATGCSPVVIAPGQVMLPLLVHHKPIGVIVLDNLSYLTDNGRYLMEVFAIQCASALENFRLYDELEGANRRAMRMLAVAAEFKDTETGDHVKRLARQTIETALELGCSEEVALEMGQASMMHDIGKIGIPDAVLLKPGKLTDDEFEVIKSHPGIGATILSEDGNFKVALQVALSHHERWDGTGYPSGLKGEEIPLAARIVSVVDVFDALVSARPYKKAWPVADALAEIRRGSGSHFDPTIVDAFLRTHRHRAELRGDVTIKEVLSSRTI